MDCQGCRYEEGDRLGGGISRRWGLPNGGMTRGEGHKGGRGWRLKGAGEEAEVMRSREREERESENRSRFRPLLLLTATLKDKQLVHSHQSPLVHRGNSTDILQRMFSIYRK